MQSQYYICISDLLVNILLLYIAETWSNGYCLLSRPRIRSAIAEISSSIIQISRYSTWWFISWISYCSTRYRREPYVSINPLVDVGSRWAGKEVIVRGDSIVKNTVWVKQEIYRLWSIGFNNCWYILKIWGILRIPQILIKLPFVFCFVFFFLRKINHQNIQ